MKKTKKIAKHLRKRARELHALADTPGALTSGDPALTDRARLFANVLQEVADQISPQSKKKLHKAAAKALKKKNGATHKPHGVHVGIGASA